MESMSDIVWAINNKNDKLDNLVNRMNVFALQSFDANKCTVHFSSDQASEQLALEMNDRKNVYLLFKEIIHNAAKHAQCQNIWIDLKVEKNKFIMHIKDDGVGFDLEKYLSNGGERSLGGNGLLNIQKRAEELKANLNLVSKEGHGTELNFEMRLTRHPLN
jgi:signal transduction histidine kinase